MKNQNEEILIQNEKLKKQNELIISQSAELEWANIYHDTIRDKEWLKNLAISPGRWAGNYSFLYVLVKILSDYRPDKILELGLGESSEIVSSFLDNYLSNSKHLIVEQDENWINSFSSKFQLSKKSEVIHLKLGIKTVNNNPVNHTIVLKRK